MDGSRLNSLAADFIHTILTSKNAGVSRLGSMFGSLMSETDREQFDSAVGQCLKASGELSFEDMQELSQEAFGYLRSHPHVGGYFVPGLIILTLNGSAQATALSLWEGASGHAAHP